MNGEHENAGERFIEESFPVKEVSVAGAREKGIRVGNIGSMHVWWARRPLATSRATAYAALIPAATDIDQWQRIRNFIAALSLWENADNRHLLNKARTDISHAHSGRVPRVLDPYSGGGSYPLEALRLGCEAYANEYNPVAVLLLKATLEYPQRFGKLAVAEPPEVLLANPDQVRPSGNPLVDAIEKWGKWVLNEATSELGEFYAQQDGSRTSAYIWARTLPCQNPACRATIPLMKQWWLANKSNRRIALYAEPRGDRLTFRIVGDGYDPIPSSFDPNRGSVAGAIATCPTCGSTIDDKTTRRLFQQGQSGEQIVAVVGQEVSGQKRTYRLPNARDYETFDRAARTLQTKREELMLEWGLDPIPDEIIRTPTGQEYVPGAVRYVFTPLLIYGLTKWSDIFNDRQKLALCTITAKTRQAYERMVEHGLDAEFAKAVTTYLALALDRLATRCSNLSVWHRDHETIEKIYALQALSMQWEYAEANVLLSDVASGYYSNIESVVAAVKRLTRTGEPAIITQASATQLPYPDEYFDAVLTDPPYYDNVPYADLSDFFYMILKRSIGHLYPELFATVHTPKSLEVIADLPLLRALDPSVDYGANGAKSSERFEELLKQSFREMHRVLKVNGVAIIVYAHKSTAGWETVINALLDSDLVVTGAWPLNTELQSRLRASEAAALASSIYIVARKMARKSTGFYNDVRDELRAHLDKKLHRLWEEGIGGGDFFIAAIGSAIEVFGKYEQVIDYEGNVVRANRLLEEVRTIATDYAVRQILHDGFASQISDLSRFYVLWRWNYCDGRVPFDEARKLAQSTGIDLAREWGRGGFVRKEKEFIHVLGPATRKLDDLEDSHELIDVLHRVLLLWEKSRRAELIQVLSSTGYGRSEAFFRVAQAISETLPNESREKKLLDGFLAGRERLRAEIDKGGNDQQSTFLEG